MLGAAAQRRGGVVEKTQKDAEEPGGLREAGLERLERPLRLGPGGPGWPPGFQRSPGGASRRGCRVPARAWRWSRALHARSEGRIGRWLGCVQMSALALKSTVGSFFCYKFFLFFFFKSILCVLLGTPVPSLSCFSSATTVPTGCHTPAPPPPPPRWLWEAVALGVVCQGL